MIFLYHYTNWNCTLQLSEEEQTWIPVPPCVDFHLCLILSWKEIITSSDRERRDRSTNSSILLGGLPEDQTIGTSEPTTIGYLLIIAYHSHHSYFHTSQLDSHIQAVWCRVPFSETWLTIHFDRAGAVTFGSQLSSRISGAEDTT